jgi:hypothetical protein
VPVGRQGSLQLPGADKHQCHDSVRIIGSSIDRRKRPGKACVAWPAAACPESCDARVPGVAFARVGDRPLRRRIPCP